MAHQVADYAHTLGVTETPPVRRHTTTHVGAALADAVLQAGLSYRSVVYPRVQRIQRDFPEAATLDGLMDIIERDAVSTFLLWRHVTKIDRFKALVLLLSDAGVDDVASARHWLCRPDARPAMLAVHGVGPKTFDYLGCLLGLEWIAVDRHVKLFVAEAGVDARDYDTVRATVSFAADLLRISRRGFDGWIWRLVANRSLTLR
ncbi:MAG: hypothetical protein WDM79_14840 [Terricaulis sp.]